jgi:hypothetical protein
MALLEVSTRIAIIQIRGHQAMKAEFGTIPTAA